MDTIHERCVVSHFGRKRPEEVPDPLLMLDIDVEIPDQHNAAIGPDAFLASAKFAGLHVAFHNVDTVLLVEGDARDLVETDNVILTNKAALPCCVIHKHPRHGCLTAGDQMRIGRYLLE